MKRFIFTVGVITKKTMVLIESTCICIDVLGKTEDKSANINKAPLVDLALNNYAHLLRHFLAFFHYVARYDLCKFTHIANIWFKCVPVCPSE